MSLRSFEDQLWEERQRELLQHPERATAAERPWLDRRAAWERQLLERYIGRAA